LLTLQMSPFNYSTPENYGTFQAKGAATPRQAGAFLPSSMKALPAGSAISLAENMRWSNASPHRNGDIGKLIVWCDKLAPMSRILKEFCDTGYRAV
jgi:hypothetical protein